MYLVGGVVMLEKSSNSKALSKGNGGEKERKKM